MLCWLRAGNRRTSANKSEKDGELVSPLQLREKTISYTREMNSCVKVLWLILWGTCIESRTPSTMAICAIIRWRAWFLQVSALVFFSSFSPCSFLGVERTSEDEHRGECLWKWLSSMSVHVKRDKPFLAKLWIMHEKLEYISRTSSLDILHIQMKKLVIQLRWHTCVSCIVTRKQVSSALKLPFFLCSNRINFVHFCVALITGSLYWPFPCLGSWFPSV